MTEAQIKHMVDRFLSWRLPENFNPDDGISFKKTYNDHLPTPTKHQPSGTNLFDANQAEAMVRFMVEGIPQNQDLRDALVAARDFVQLVREAEGADEAADAMHVLNQIDAALSTPVAKTEDKKMSIKITDDPDVCVTAAELARYTDEYQRAFMFYCGTVPTLAEFIRRKQTQKPLRDRMEIHNG